MRAARALIPTLRDDPADAVAISHRLIVRAGMARQLGAGIWSWLPLGYRVIKRIEAIIREEMDRIGGQELLMPVLHPAEIWKASGRYGIDELFKLQDRAERDLVLAMTHEEIIALHAAQAIRSYRDLPQIWYHLQLKERDEPRPTGGVLRTREFTMKDSYTLDRDAAGLDHGYALHEQAYHRIFERCGLEFWKVESDTGYMGGSMAHEYMAPSPAGENEIALCDRCDYAANVEMARGRASMPTFPEAGPATEIATPDVATIDALAAFLHIDPRTTTKAMPVVQDDGKLVLGLVRGDRRLHELKLRKVLGQDFRPARADEIRAAFGADGGSLGPVALRPGAVERVVADETLAKGVFVAGANRNGYHLTGVVPGRDFDAESHDIQVAEAGDGCPLCDGTLRIEPAIEIGNIFKLGTRYAEAFGATYLDEQGREQPIVMGSYGIGPARIAASAVEQTADDAGIAWPAPIAPYDAWLVTIGAAAAAPTEQLEGELEARGLSTMIDDREQSPGSKFADADLIGVPLRVTIGKRTVSEGTVDIRVRRDGRQESVALDAAADRLAELHAELMSTAAGAVA